MEKYEVRYEDNTGCENGITTYATEEKAEAAIKKQLEEVKEYFQFMSSDYDYRDFGTKTEIWEKDGNQYASWERLWK